LAVKEFEMITNKLRRTLIVGALVSASVLAGCVSQEKYNKLNDAYVKLQQAYQGDEVEIKQLQGELKVTIKDKILFPEGGFRLDAKAQAVLAKMVPTLSGFQNTKIVVRGYTDSVPIGADLKREGVTTNLDLSSKRADNVVDFLLKKGVSANLISAQGMGESNPVASNNTPDGRAQNRRIEVTLVGPGN
jgi:chemotaxis protein MotB